MANQAKRSVDILGSILIVSFIVLSIGIMTVALFINVSS